MSGHSHYATIHRQKELKDAAKGQVFSKLARAITIAAKSGGGPDPDSNFKLRIAIDKARAVSMPRENIDRAIDKARGAGEALDEVVYEGFGPSGIELMVEVATDNRNRTNAEIRNLFDKNGGKMGSPGSVAFNFDPKGLLLIQKNNPDEQLLKLIDLAVEDFNEMDDVIEVFVNPKELMEFQKKISGAGFTVTTAELIQRPKNMVEIADADKEKVEKFLENFDNHDDVQKVFSNANY